MERRDPSRVGELVRRHRIGAALSQEALAERAGLSVRAISDLERGVHRVPRLETVRLLAEALRLDAADRAELLAAAHPLATVPVALGIRVSRHPWLRGSPRSARARAVRPIPSTGLTGSH